MRRGPPPHLLGLFYNLISSIPSYRTVQFVVWRGKNVVGSMCHEGYA